VARPPAGKFLMIMGIWSLGDGVTSPKPPGPPTASPGAPLLTVSSRPNQTKHTPKREQAIRSQHDRGSTGGGAWRK